MLAAVRIHAATAAWSPAEVEAAREQGRAITQATFSVLSSNLQQALAHGGVTNALTFCSLQALNLTVLQVNTNLVELRRVSHRPRNLRNAASAEERLVLERFEAELKQRGTVAPVVETNHSDRLIFRGPIVLNNPLCLNCHGRPGAEIQPEHLEVLRRLYPDDQATGFRLGELRGFWSVSFRREALEVSVKPGINAEYLKDDLDPTQWVERFEREGREIYDQRTRIVQSLGLRPGMSVCIPPRTIHQFWGEEGTGLTVSSEVSSVCDDWSDNFFLEPAERFPKLVEDAPRTHYLCHEYPAAK